MAAVAGGVRLPRRQLEQVISTRIVGSAYDLTKAANEAFVPGKDVLLTPDMAVYQAMLEETVRQHEAYKDKYGTSPPRRQDKSESRYRRTIRLRLGRYVKRRGWTDEQVRVALWWAASRGSLIRPAANVLILEALTAGLPSSMITEEEKLFSLAHVTTLLLRRGAVLLPPMWDPVLRSLWVATSQALRERLNYVHTQPTSKWPHRWREETDRALVGYLQLYKLVMDEMRERDRRRKAGGPPRLLFASEQENSEEKLSRLRFKLNGGYPAATEVGTEGRHIKGEGSRLLGKILEELESANLLDVGQIDELLDATGKVADRLQRVAELVAANALKRSHKARQYLGLYAQFHSVKEVASRAGCKRPNVTRRLDHAVATIMGAVADLPLTSRLMRDRLGEMGLGDRLRRLFPPPKGKHPPLTGSVTNRSTR